MRYMLTKLSNINLHKSSRELPQLVYCNSTEKKNCLKSSQIINQSIHKHATVDSENQLW